MSGDNNIIPFMIAAGVGAIGCATALYFSNAESNPQKRKREYPIRSEGFDDDDKSRLNKYTEYSQSSKRIKKKPIQDSDDDSEEDSDDEDEISEEGDEYNEDDFQEDENDDKYLVSNGRKQKNRK
jgi:hypothetical protein